MRTLRPMAIDDLDTVLEIIEENEPGLRSTAAEGIGRALTPTAGRKGSFLVAEVDGEVVGCLGWTPDPLGAKDIAWLVWGYVRPDLHRQGIGSALFKEAEATMISGGVRKFYLDVGNPDTHQAAIAFHRSRGYRLEGRLVDFWSEGEDMLIFGKKASG
jgi:ribosomal protein S18 acetylase RimI-like enzyme